MISKHPGDLIHLKLCLLSANLFTYMLTTKTTFRASTCCARFCIQVLHIALCSVVFESFNQPGFQNCKQACFVLFLDPIYMFRTNYATTLLHNEHLATFHYCNGMYLHF